MRGDMNLRRGPARSRENGEGGGEAEGRPQHPSSASVLSALRCCNPHVDACAGCHEHERTGLRARAVKPYTGEDARFGTRVCGCILGVWRLPCRPVSISMCL